MAVSHACAIWVRQYFSCAVSVRQDFYHICDRSFNMHTILHTHFFVHQQHELDTELCIISFMIIRDKTADTLLSTISGELNAPISDSPAKISRERKRVPFSREMYTFPVKSRILDFTGGVFFSREKKLFHFLVKCILFP